MKSYKRLFRPFLPAALLACAFAGASFTCLAAECPQGTGQPAYFIADPASGCKVWNSNPNAGETIRYEGACVDGYAQGKGEVSWFVDGRKMEVDTGSFARGQLEGRASLVFFCGDEGRFDGVFRDGKKNGAGVETNKKGFRYEGGYRDDLLEGRGKLVFEGNAGSYEGEFRAGKLEGQGRLVHPTRGTYEGGFRADKFEGKGVLQLRGARYEGEFHDDKFEGFGRYTLASGARYEGAFREGQFDGDGTLVSVNGDRFDGHFVRGLREGPGLTTFANGDKRMGLYKAGKRVGELI